jgi:D-3-phosphoglycerate dehydrogenase
MPHRAAILDDYQNVALSLADWSTLGRDVELKVFNKPIGNQAAVIAALKDFDIVCLMRERTPFPRAVIEALPNLKLLITTGMRNAAVDVSAASERGVTVCGTDMLGHPTAELTIGLMLELARKVGVENARMKAGAWWQETIGIDLKGKTLGVIGLGKLGAQVAHIAQAFGMKVIAWSANLTQQRCREVGATLASKQSLFQSADFVTIHVVLSARSRGLVGAADLALMKPNAFLINTSRGPVVDTAALIAALRAGKIAGAGIDVFDEEPLPRDHPLRTLANAVVTPHLGYVTADNYRVCYAQTAEDIRAWLDGKPVRVIGAK